MKRAVQWMVYLLLAASSSGFARAHPQSQTTGDFLLSSDSTHLSLGPGSVGTRQVVLRNGTDQLIKGRIQPHLPEGWTMLIPPPAVSLEPGDNRSQLVSFQIPRSTSAGSYNVEIRFSFEERLASPGDSLRTPQNVSHSQFLSWTVQVTERRDVSAEWIEQIPLVRAGSEIKGSLRITNNGNATSSWRISVRSSLGYNTKSSPSIIELVEGESALVDVSADSREDISTRLDHALSVEISSVSSPAPSGSEKAPIVQLSMRTQLIPVLNRLAIRSEGQLPASLTLSGITEDGNRAGQVEFRIDETAVKDVVVAALIRTPDVRRTSSFSAPDRYSLRIANPSWEILLGDQSYGLSDLLEPGTLGFGAGARVRIGKWTTGGFAQQSRKVFPERQQAGASVEFKPIPTIKIEANALAKRQFEEGNLASLAAEFQPGSQYIRTEVAIGDFEGKTGRAAEAEVSLEKGIVSTSFQAEKADKNFRGAIRSTEGLRGSATLRATDWLRVQGQYRGRRRFYDVASGPDATQTSTSTRLGMTATLNRDRFRAFMTVTGQRQTNNNTLSQLDREDASIEARLGFNRRRLGMNATVERGQSKDPLSPSLSPYNRATTSVFGSRRSFSFNMSGSWLQGPTLYNPTDQERLSWGMNLGWEPGELTRMTMGVFRSTDLLRSDQAFTMADARITRQFRNGHEVWVRSRFAQTSFDSTIRNATVTAAWSIPLFLPVPGMGSATGGRLTGRIVDFETGLPIEGVIVRVDAMEAVSESDGSWELKTGDSPVVYVSIDRSSIGFDRRPVGTFPMAVELATIPETGLEINIVPSTSLSIQMELAEATGPQKDAALNDALTQASLSGILIEIRSGQDRMRRLTDRDGKAEFTDLVPGQWSVFAVGGSLPPESETRPDTLRMDLVASSAAQASLELRKRTRQIRIVGSGGAVIGGLSVGSVKRVPVVREDAPKDVAKEDGARDTKEPDAEKEAMDETVRDAVDVSLPTEHIVQKGETLSVLARRYYGSTVHWVRLWQSNQDRMVSKDVLLPGTVLSIPPGGRLTDQEKQVIQELEADQR